MKKKMKKLRRGEKDEDNIQEIMSQMPGYLYSDLLLEILLRSDAKTLGRCRCVCRTWKEVISSPGFINMHHDQSLLRNSPNLLFVGKFEDNHGRCFSRFTAVDPNHMDREGSVTTIESSRMSIRFERELPVCCDLLCFWSSFKEDIKLCNPRTGQIRSLPPPSDDKTWIGWEGNLVFGYVASKEEYTLVSLRTNPIKTMAERKILAKKFTFSSSSNSISSSAWKDIEESCPRFVRSGILINSFMYWLIASPGKKLGEDLKLQAFQRRKNEVIVSLNLDMEKFGIINCPPTPTWESKAKLDSPHITMIDFKGTLSLIDTMAMSRTNTLELWALKSNSFWEKEHRIQLGFPVNHPQPLIHPKSSKNGELIMSSAVVGKYYLCNPRTNSWRVVTQPDQIHMGSSAGHLMPNFIWESLFSFTNLEQ